ncbi:hypothetical protein BS50DRAFT_669024 [Corynespora cassiicola Philippines]|uniref:Uncharacterized protein n=1 Tax=Corynespora cassiicola Philippines TaxID=1448308 RepID=A0A2T2NLF4_CORCC|nr:hypothetical protein BS50DRAFT_669024 [Corynespora cassiicola Philippines]
MDGSSHYTDLTSTQQGVPSMPNRTGTVTYQANGSWTVEINQVITRNMVYNHENRHQSNNCCVIEAMDDGGPIPTLSDFASPAMPMAWRQQQQQVQKYLPAPSPAPVFWPFQAGRALPQRNLRPYISPYGPPPAQEKPVSPSSRAPIQSPGSTSQDPIVIASPEASPPRPRAPTRPKPAIWDKCYRHIKSHLEGNLAGCRFHVRETRWFNTFKGAPLAKRHHYCEMAWESKEAALDNIRDMASTFFDFDGTYRHYLYFAGAHKEVDAMKEGEEKEQQLEKLRSSRSKGVLAAKEDLVTRVEHSDLELFYALAREIRRERGMCEEWATAKQGRKATKKRGRGEVEKGSEERPAKKTRASRPKSTPKPKNASPVKDSVPPSSPAAHPQYILTDDDAEGSNDEDCIASHQKKEEVLSINQENAAKEEDDGLEEAMMKELLGE